MEELSILPPKSERINGMKYLYNDRIVIWNNKLKCEHNKNRCECVECGGSQICEHKRSKNTCKECGGCGICEHGKKRTVCKDCGGGGLCEHKQQRSSCRLCGGSSICEHKISRYECRQCGGSGICKHGKLKGRCIECGGAQLCEHKKRKSQCKDCSPNQYLAYLLRMRVSDRLKNYSKNNRKHTMEYVGCTIDELRSYLEKQFTNNMSWENKGEWHIDHIRPCASFNLDNEIERHMCFHYTNLQPLWASENISKGSKYVDESL
jgi:hypothetical protein